MSAEMPTPPGELALATREDRLPLHPTLQILREIERGGVALTREDMQRAKTDGLEIVGHAGCDSRRRRRLDRPHLVDEYVGRRLVDRAGAAKDLVKGDAECVDVRATIRRGTFRREQLGSHVLQSSHDFPGTGERVAARFGTRQTEIRDLQHTVGRHEHVRRFHVAMKDAGFMRRVKTSCGLREDVRPRFVGVEIRRWRDESVPHRVFGGATVQQGIERDAVDELHRDPRRSVVFAVIVDADDVAVHESLSRQRFAAESFGRHGIAPCPENRLQGHAAPGDAVFRLVDDAHAAATHFAEDDEPSDAACVGHLKRLPTALPNRYTMAASDPVRVRPAHRSR